MAKRRGTSSTAASVTEPPSREQVEEAMRDLLWGIGPCSRLVGFAKRLCEERFSGEHLMPIQAHVRRIIVDALDNEGGDAEFTITKIDPVTFICLV